MPAMSLITVPKYRLSDSDCRRSVKACQVMFYASRDGKKNAMGNDSEEKVQVWGILDNGVCDMKP